MAQKVLALSASPRRGGNSDVLCDRFLMGAQAAGHEAEKIFINDKKINYCSGCGNCFDCKESCSQEDDMQEILEKMIGSDVIVMATPVYFYTMAAQMKTLIDRTCSRYQELSDKDFYFIITCADSDDEATAKTLDGFRAFLSCLTGAREKGTVHGTGVWRIGDVNGKPAMKEAYNLGRSIL